MAQTEVQGTVRGLFQRANGSRIHILNFSIATSPFYHTKVSDGNSDSQIGGAVNRENK